MKIIIISTCLLIFHLGVYSQYNLDKTEYSKKHFKYTEYMILTSVQPNFDKYPGENPQYAVSDFYEKGSVWRAFTYDFIKILKKHITIDQFKQACGEEHRKSGSTVDISFDYDGNILFARFRMSKSWLTVLTDKKLYEMYFDLKKVKFDHSNLQWQITPDKEPNKKVFIRATIPFILITMKL